MAELWRWLPSWGKALLVLAILAILGVVVYFILKFIVLIVVAVGITILILYELGGITRTNHRKRRSRKRLGGMQSKDTDTRSPEVSTHQENNPQNAPQHELQFRQKFPAPHRATDGHNVRSKAELLIDNYLYHNNIAHAYETKLPVEEELYCDFYIQKGDKKVYIEYWGYKYDPKYLRQKQWKIGIYKKYGFQLIQLNDKDISTLDDVLPRKLREFGIETDLPNSQKGKEPPHDQQHESR